MFQTWNVCICVYYLPIIQTGRMESERESNSVLFLARLLINFWSNILKMLPVELQFA